MFTIRRAPRKAAIALAMLVVLIGLVRAGATAAGPATSHVAVTAGIAETSGTAKPLGKAASGKPLSARTVSARTLSATSTALPAGGPCSVPGIGDIAGLLGFCSLGQSGILGGINNLCQPGVPQPESAATGVNALIKPPASPGKQIATPYNQYGMAGQYWAPTDLQCSDMTSLIGNDVAGMLFDFAKALDRVTITVYQSAAGEGILGWLQGVTDRLISGLGNAVYFPYVAIVVILAAIWLAWQGLIRKRGTRTIEGTIWMVVACAAAIWLIGRPADFTGLGKGVSDGISTTLNTAFANLPSPGQSSCLPVKGHDPQISPSSYSYTSSRTVVDQNANELWTVLVCKPWLDGEFGTTAVTANGRPTPVSAFARQLLWSQAMAVNERPTTTLINAKQAAYEGIAQTIKTKDPSVYPLFQGKQWTTRLEIAFAALLAAVVAGVLVLLISVTLILLKLGFLLLLIVGPFFLLIGTHPGFGRVVAVRWFEMLVGVLLKQAAVALALSVLLYCYALIMGTSDAALPWALKILMITLVTVAVVIYRKPFQHLFAAVGYGAIGATERSEADLSRAAAKARENTRAAASLTMPGFAAYRAARWARRNPAQAAGLALNAATAASTAGVAAGAAAGTEASGAEENAAAAQAGVTAGAGDATGSSAGAGATGRARAWGASAGTASASDAPPLRLPPSQGAPASWGTNGSSEPAAKGAGSAAPPLPPLARSAGASSGGQVRSAASRAGVAQRQSGSAAPARRPSPGGSGGSIPAGIPPSWSSRGQAPRRPAPPQRSPAADRAAPQQPRRQRAAAADRPARPWSRSGEGPARQDAPRQDSPRQERPRQERPPRRGGESGRPARDSSGQSSRGGSGAPFGLQPKSADEPSASPFWSRPIWRRK
ncbi:MAG TPA: type IV secretion system protein [Streptosporangiaceae bacterium]|nr:type IV secretion system protein [Streptosporangiaceae bacterium]